jgi:hypothetical protein
LGDSCVPAQKCPHVPSPGLGFPCYLVPIEGHSAHSLAGPRLPPQPFLGHTFPAVSNATDQRSRQDCLQPWQAWLISGVLVQVGGLGRTCAHQSRALMGEPAGYSSGPKGPGWSPKMSLPKCALRESVMLTFQSETETWGRVELSFHRVT